MAKPKTTNRRRDDAAIRETSAEFFARVRGIITPDDILEVGMKLGAIERQRKVDFPALVQATILAFSPQAGTQMTAFQNYLALAGEDIAPSSFYDHFNAGYAKLMRELTGRALRAVRDAVPDGRESQFGALLEHFDDVRITDSTAQFLKRFAKRWARSTSKARPAAIKAHVQLSLREQVPAAMEITEQRVHDNKAFPEDTLTAGVLHMFDLGYIDVERFVAMALADAFFLTRLKDSHNPEILTVRLGRGDRKACRGLKLDDALEAGLLQPNEDGLMEVEVQLQGKAGICIARIIGERDTDGGLHWYLTNVPREVLSAKDVPEAYRIRWYIELFFKQTKTGLGFDAIRAWNEQAVAALVYAKVIAICLARLLELAAQEEAAQRGDYIVTQLASVLVLARSMGLFIAHQILAQGHGIDELERRILLIGSVAARARNQRREREKRRREAGLGR